MTSLKKRLDNRIEHLEKRAKKYGSECTRVRLNELRMLRGDYEETNAFNEFKMDGVKPKEKE
jgi:hypothetical protein